MAVGKYLDFLLFLKTVIFIYLIYLFIYLFFFFFFSKNTFIFFQSVLHLRLYTFAVFVKGIPLQIRNRPTAEIPIYSWNQSLCGLVFGSIEPFFKLWKQIKVAAAWSGLYGGLNNSCELKELISSTVHETVWEETLSCKRRTFFWAGPNK